MPVNQPVPNRANTDEAKEACLTRLLRVWKKHPHLRLGQLLENAVRHPPEGMHFTPALFYVEDTILVESAERFDRETSDT